MPVTIFERPIAPDRLWLTSSLMRVGGQASAGSSLSLLLDRSKTSNRDNWLNSVGSAWKGAKMLVRERKKKVKDIEGQCQGSSRREKVYNMARLQQWPTSRRLPLRSRCSSDARAKIAEGSRGILRPDSTRRRRFGGKLLGTGRFAAMVMDLVWYSASLPDESPISLGSGKVQAPGDEWTFHRLAKNCASRAGFACKEKTEQPG